MRVGVQSRVAADRERSFIGAFERRGHHVAAGMRHCDGRRPWSRQPLHLHAADRGAAPQWQASESSTPCRYTPRIGMLAP